jgi:hypothetical protein
MEIGGDFTYSRKRIVNDAVYDHVLSVGSPRLVGAEPHHIMLVGSGSGGGILYLQALYDGVGIVRLSTTGVESELFSLSLLMCRDGVGYGYHCCAICVLHHQSCHTIIALLSILVNS